VPFDQLTALYLAATELVWTELGRATPATARELRSTGATVLAIARRAVSAVADGYNESQRRAVADEEAVRQDFIDDLLQGRRNPGLLSERAERFGVILAGEHIVTVASTDHPFGPDDPVARTIEDALTARFGPRNVLVAVRDGLLVCIVPSSLRGTTGELVHHLVTTIGVDSRWQVGVGRPHSGPGGVLKSYEEARGVLDLAGRLGFHTPVLRAADLLVFPVLLRDRGAMVELVRSVLGPLTDARGGPQPMLDTLWAFFTAQGNITATARQLGISPRAVQYRLDRIRSLTGYTPTEPTQRFTLEAAVLGARVLGWPEEHLTE
jgi:sugar diacid utilization regulator